MFKLWQNAMCAVGTFSSTLSKDYSFGSLDKQLMYDYFCVCSAILIEMRILVF